MSEKANQQEPVYDLGHRGDVDLTQIEAFMALSPTERLRHHERWRYFLKKFASGATLLRRGTPEGRGDDMAETLNKTSVKEEVLRLIQRLPDDCTLQDIQYHLHVRARVEEGIRAIDEGRVVSQEEAERISAEWLKSSGQTQP
jgi:hypothetical protein